MFVLIDWFHAWLEDALYFVAKRFISDLNFDENVHEVLIRFITREYTFVLMISEEFLESENRYNLELIAIFKRMLENARVSINDII